MAYEVKKKKHITAIKKPQSFQVGVFTILLVTKFIFVE